MRPSARRRACSASAPTPPPSSAFKTRSEAEKAVTLEVDTPGNPLLKVRYEQ